MNMFPSDAIALDATTIVALSSTTISKSTDFGQNLGQMFLNQQKTLREIDGQDNVLFCLCR